MMDCDQTAGDYATKTLITFENNQNIEWRIGNHQSFSSTHGCIVAKMPGTSEPSFKPIGNLSPTEK